MQKILTTVLVLLITASLFAQHEPIQPFEELGIKVKVLTLSNGKYQESFPNDTTFRFGSVMFNRVTGEVVTVIENDTLYGEYNLKAEVVSRWLSPDPLATEFSNWSPYSFSFNNPIIFNDPDGMAPDNVIITGPDADKAVAHLNEASDLKITRNAESGLLTAEGEAKTKAEKQLLKAINDPNNHVVLETTDAQKYDDPKDGSKNNVLLPGGFMGSDVVEKDGAKEVTGTQKVNIGAAEKIAGVTGEKTGETLMHEINEAYFGTKLDPGGNYSTGFEKSHAAAKKLDKANGDFQINNSPRLNPNGTTSRDIKIRMKDSDPWTTIMTIKN